MVSASMCRSANLCLFSYFLQDTDRCMAATDKKFGVRSLRIHVFWRDEENTTYPYAENAYAAKTIPWPWTGEQSCVPGPVKQVLCPSDPAHGDTHCALVLQHFLLLPPRCSTGKHCRAVKPHFLLYCIPCIMFMFYSMTEGGMKINVRQNEKQKGRL